MNSKGNGNGSQACASCKYQRRRCNSDCPLAPYFRPDQHKQFLNAHRLFGVSNILKILKNLDVSQHPEAMKTIIFESNMRNKDPVRGCYGVIEDTKKQIEWVKAELELTLGHLNNIKQQLQIHNNVVDIGINGATNGSFNAQQFYGVPLAQAQQHQYMVENHVNQAMMGMDVGMVPGVHMGLVEGSPTPWVQESPMHPGESLCSKQVSSGSPSDARIQDCDEFKHFIDMFDDRQSFISPKEPLECSDESSFKEEQQDHELKQAAQLFSLRNDIQKDSLHI